MGKINLKAGTGKSKASTPPQEKQTEVLGVLDFGPSLIDGESAADYEAFRQGCHKAIEPKDEIERVWLGDFITYTWEAQRLRRMKTVFLPTARKEAVETLVKQFGGEIVNSTKAKEISEKWSISDPDHLNYVESLLEQHGLTLDTIMAQVIVKNLKTLVDIDQLIASYDYRRDASLRELEKRRDMLAKRAREFAESLVEEANPVIVEAAE